MLINIRHTISKGKFVEMFISRFASLIFKMVTRHKNICKSTRWLIFMLVFQLNRSLESNTIILKIFKNIKLNILPILVMKKTLNLSTISVQE